MIFRLKPEATRAQYPNIAEAARAQYYGRVASAFRRKILI
jgi:hypothetical protein